MNRTTLLIAAVGVCLGAAALRLPHLGAKELWFDEAYSVYVGSGQSHGIVEELAHDSGVPLYYVLLRGWMRLFSTRPADVRSLSAVLGILTVGVVMLAGHRFGSPIAGLASGALLAVSPLAINYAREARMYALLALLTALVFWLTFEARQRGRWWLWCLAGLCLLLSLYTHHYGLFLLTVPVTYGVLPPVRRRSASAPFIVTALVLVVYGMTWLPVLLRQLQQTGAGDWLAKVTHGVSAGEAVRRTLQCFGFGSFPSYLRLHQAMPDNTAASCVGLVLLLGLAAAGVVYGARTRQVPNSAPSLLLLLGVALPIALPLGYGIVRAPIYLSGRYDVVAQIPFILLAGLGVEAVTLWTGFPRAALLTLAIALAWPAISVLAVYLPAQYRAEQSAPFGAPGDRVICAGLACPLVWYDLAQRRIELPIVAFPSEQWQHAGFTNTQAFKNGGTMLRSEAEDLARNIAGHMEPGASVYLVFTLEDDTMSPVLQHLADHLERGVGPLDVAASRLQPAPTYLLRFVRRSR